MGEYIMPTESFLLLTPVSLPKDTLERVVQIAAHFLSSKSFSSFLSESMIFHGRVVISNTTNSRSSYIVGVQKQSLLDIYKGEVLFQSIFMISDQTCKGKK